MLPREDGLRLAIRQRDRQCRSRTVNPLMLPICLLCALEPGRRSSSRGGFGEWPGALAYLTRKCTRAWQLCETQHDAASGKTTGACRQLVVDEGRAEAKKGACGAGLQLPAHLSDPLRRLRRQLNGCGGDVQQLPTVGGVKRALLLQN
jgi:hypothetical protein